MSIFSILGGKKTPKYPTDTIQDREDNDVKITFFKNGEWKEVDAESASVTFEMPEGLIPIQLRQYVEANYMGIRINSIEKEGRFTDVSLANGLDLRFDSNYRLVNIDD